MKIGHVSDLHILEFDRPRPWQFANKRVVGGTNLLLNRSKSHSTPVVELALAKINEIGVDHLAISGDLTNLALDSEFKAAAKILATIPEAENHISLVPGNHDYYTYKSARVRRFETYFAPYMHSDLPDYQLPTGYPFCKLIGDDVALIGLNSGLASFIFFATGQVDPEELRQAEALLDDPAVRNRFKIVMIHHPILPVNFHRIEYNRRLLNAPEVLHMIRKRGVNLVVHGHTHHHQTEQVPHLNGPGTTYICEAGCTSIGQHPDPERAGKFNIYHINDRRLDKIETHLYDPTQNQFNLWRTVDF